MPVSSGTKDNFSPNVRAILHHPNGVVQWCSLGGNGYLALSILKSSRRESDCKLNLDSSENITQDPFCGVHNACSLLQVNRRGHSLRHWCAKIKDEVEKLAYQLNEEAERTERPIRRLSKVMYGSTCADMQVDVMGECLSSIKHVVGARRNRRQTAGEIARHMTQATRRPISRFTVARRLHGGGLFARRPVRCVPLTPAHRRRRSLWCREHQNWRDNEWGRVLFTDESRFSLSSDSHRILIWRERGSRNHPSNIIERDRYGGRGVLVWGGIMLGSRTDLQIFDAGSVNGTRYCNEILLPYVRLFRGAMGLQFLFMDDNAPSLLPSRRLAARTLPPVTIRELRLALQDEWAAMPQQLIDTLILSMSRRCETCLAVRGDHIPY
ncbi:transposable element Tcb2 transposase [Trichonephila clavipes]|uniref:Transposable element Tcb2 transposase n=1 Tax=Trichonephila clavipes TaxID=2585209 RepID=A0A8X6RR18_TRICX|nr:transposable element Tcb2 transposase [Trichonephila clavipes]